LIDFLDPKKLLSSGLIEVKGWWDKKSKIKAELTKTQYPQIYKKITFIDFGKMNILRAKYSPLIPEWESSK